MVTKKARASSREIPPWTTIKEGRTESNSFRTRDLTTDCSPYLSKSPREIQATEKVARTFEQPPCLPGCKRSRGMSKYCHFYEDHGHDTNQCRELRHQIKEAVKSGWLAHLVKEVRKGKAKVLNTQLGEWKKGNRGTMPTEAPILTIRRRNNTPKRKSTEESTRGLRKTTFSPISRNDNSSDTVIIKAKISGKRKLVRSHLRAMYPITETFH
ncbi:hypothetical protein Tco_0016484 [Tanacetum coccineum]